MSFKEKRLEEVKDDLLLLGIGLGVENQSRIPKIFKDLKERLGIEFNNEDQKKARDVAVLKRDSKKFKAFFGEVFKRRKTKESKMGKINREEAIRKVQGLMKEIQDLSKEFGIKDDELSLQKIEERKKEAVDKGIFEKAVAITQEFGKIRPNGDVHSDPVRRFRNRDLIIDAYSLVEPIKVEIYTIVKERIFKSKKLVFRCHRDTHRNYKCLRDSLRVGVYKPGGWEKLLDTLYKAALTQKEKRTKERFSL